MRHKSAPCIPQGSQFKYRQLFTSQIWAKGVYAKTQWAQLHTKVSCKCNSIKLPGQLKWSMSICFHKPTQTNSLKDKQEKQGWKLWGSACSGTWSWLAVRDTTFTANFLFIRKPEGNRIFLTVSETRRLMEVWEQRSIPSAFPPSRQARFLDGLFSNSPEVSSALLLKYFQESEEDPFLGEGLDPAKFFALSRAGEGPRKRKRRRRRKRPGIRAAASSYGKRKVQI